MAGDKVMGKINVCQSSNYGKGTPNNSKTPTLPANLAVTVAGKGILVSMANEVNNPKNYSITLDTTLFWSGSVGSGLSTKIPTPFINGFSIHKSDTTGAMVQYLDELNKPLIAVYNGNSTGASALSVSDVGVGTITFLDNVKKLVVDGVTLFDETNYLPLDFEVEIPYTTSFEIYGGDAVFNKRG